MKTTATSCSNSLPRVLRGRIALAPLTLLTALALALTVRARAQTPPPTIPFPDIGARATAHYQGDALGVTATTDGARLRCGFQKLEGHATREGLWLESTKPGGGQLRLVAVAVWRGGSRARPCALTEAASSGRSGMAIGTVPQSDQAPLGAPCTHGAASLFDMPLLTELETTFSDVPFYRPAAPNGAVARLRQGAQTLARTGKVCVGGKLVRFTRPGLTEEYSVSVDGVRQDFVIESPPLNPQRSTLNQSAGDVVVELALSGARAEAAAGGARLALDGSGRALAYSRLRVEDARGRELTARLEVLSADRLAVSVADANATYPVRIDPTFSDADWVSLGSGMNNRVDALAVSGTNLYAGGLFSTAGGVTANGIAKWDGSAWSALGSGMGGTYPWVSALAVSGTNLYAGGYFTTAGGVSANGIAKWDGSAWSALGSGMGGNNPWVFALVVSGTDLYAEGGFTSAGGVPANHIAKWDGSAWSALGSGVGGWSGALAVSGNNLYAGGNFTTAGGVTANYIAKWDGSAWSALGSGMNTEVDVLAMSGTNLYAGGLFSTAGGVTANGIAKWDGSAWSALGSGMDYSVLALAVSGTNLYAGGNITTAGGVTANNIAKWDGETWSALGSGVDANVHALAADGLGHLFVGGAFSLAGTNVSPYIAQANLGSAPTILTPPQTQTAEAGSAVGLWVQASGSSPLFCLWSLNYTNLVSCSTNWELELTNVQFAQSGAYTLVISNALGAVTSAPVMLNVIAPVERRPVPGVKVTGGAGSLWNVDYASYLSPAPNWTTLGSISLTSTSQYYFDLTLPLPPQRFYRALQTGTPGVMPSLDLHLVPAITLTGNIGHSVRLDYINRFGPIDAWITLDTVALTNTSQLYFDTSSIGQPQRLYRLVPLP
jgi:hypothetical protein